MKPQPSSFETFSLKSTWVDTPLGSMVAVGDEAFLYLLRFTDGPSIEKSLEKLQSTLKTTILPGITPPLELIRSELNAYFEGTLKEFKTPFLLQGSPFYQTAWEELIRTPYGTTRSYADQALSLGKHTAYRAVANANASNQLVIVVPCHRIIHKNGDLGGYGEGLSRKKWLLEHERRHVS